MFGFSFGELVVLVIVAVIVIGPKDMPKVLRRVGQWAAKARRMASDLRAQSGIDDVLKGEGLAQDIAEIRRLARGEIDGVVSAARIDVAGTSATGPRPVTPVDPYGPAEITIDRDREYPREGADGYAALSDAAIVYAESFPKSPLARDPLYLVGDPDAKVEDDAPAAAAEPGDAPAPVEPSHP